MSLNRFGLPLGDSVRVLVRWSPALVTAGYLGLYVARFPSLVRREYWDSDVAVLTVAAQTLGHGTEATFAHCGWFTSWWFLLVTRSLPLHRQLWEVAPTLGALAAVGILAWASWRLAGRWAGAMTLAIGVAVSPVVSYSRIAWDFHEPASLAAVVLAGFALWLTRSPPRRRVLAAAVVVGALAGTSLASDGLFAVVGLIPFATTGLVFGLVLGRRFEALVILACSAAALPVEWTTNWIMSREDFVVSPAAPLSLAPLSDLASNFERLLGLIVEVGNGNFSGVGWVTPAATFTYALSVACAVLVVAGLGAPVVLLRRQLRSRAPAGAGLLVWSTFWSACLIANSLGYALSKVGTETGFYLLSVVYVAAATVPIALVAGRRRRTLGAVAISVVAATSLINLVRTPRHASGIAAVASRIVAIARAEHAPYGYTANYEDAASLTWSTNYAVHVRAVRYCGSVVCPFSFNALTQWYQPHHTRSFLIEEPAPFYLGTGQFGPPLATFSLGGQYVMDVFGYDVARRLADATVAYGGGFNAAEQYQGTTSRWMIQGGQIAVQTVADVEVVLTTLAFSNQGSRTLELVERGRVLGRDRIPTYAVPIRFGPIRLPPGITTFELVASPGPVPLGGNDPRQASVFLEPFSAQTRATFAR